MAISFKRTSRRCVPALFLLHTEHHAIAVRAAKGGCAVEHAMILGQTGDGNGAVAAVEAVENGFGPIGIELEHRPIVVGATDVCRTVKLARSCPQQIALGIGPVSAAGESMKHGITSILRQLERHAVVAAAAKNGGAVETALLVALQPA